MSVGKRDDTLPARARARTPSLSQRTRADGPLSGVTRLTVAWARQWRAARS